MSVSLCFSNIVKSDSIAKTNERYFQRSATGVLEFDYVIDFKNEETFI